MYKVENGQDVGIEDFDDLNDAIKYANNNINAKEIFLYDNDEVIKCVWKI